MSVALATGAELDGAALQADADLLRRAYTAPHPGLLRYQTAEEAQQRFAELGERFRRPASLSDAYVAFLARDGGGPLRPQLPQPRQPGGPRARFDRMRA